MEAFLPSRSAPRTGQCPSHDIAPCEIHGQWQVEPDADGCQVGTVPPSLVGGGRRSHRQVSGEQAGLARRVGAEPEGPWAEEGAGRIPHTQARGLATAENL